MTVGVADPATQNILVEPQVIVEMDFLEGVEAPVSIPATHENAINQLWYEAILRPEREGVYQIVVEVMGTAGSGQTAFEVEVLPPIPFFLKWGPYLLGGLVGIVCLVWWWRQSKQGPAALRPKRPINSRP